jgi:hypothetical protein
VVWDGVGFEVAHVGLLSVGIGWEREPQVTFGAGAELVTDFEGVGSMRNHFIATSFIGGYGFYKSVAPCVKSDRHRRPPGGRPANRPSRRDLGSPRHRPWCRTHTFGRPHLVTPANTSKEP